MVSRIFSRIAQGWNQRIPVGAVRERPCSSQRSLGRLGFEPSILMGGARLFKACWDFIRAYMDVGHAGLVWSANAPCIAGIPNIPVGQSIDRPAGGMVQQTKIPVNLRPGTLGAVPPMTRWVVSATQRAQTGQSSSINTMLMAM